MPDNPNGGPPPVRAPETVTATLTVGPYELDLTITARFAPGQEPDMPVTPALGFILASQGVGSGPITLPPPNPDPVTPPAQVAPVFTSGATSVSTPENTAVPFVVAVYSASNGAALSMRQGDATKYSFTPSTGELRRTAPMDYETEQVATVQIRATGSNGLTVDRTLVHSITDVVENIPSTAPTVAALTMPSMMSLTPTQTPSQGFVSGSYVSTSDVGERVTNGTFAATTGWALSGGVAISNGTLNFNSPNRYDGAIQNLTVVPGYFYRLAYTITAMTGGTIYAEFIGGGNGPYGTGRTSAGSYVQALQAVAGNTGLKITAGAVGTIASLDSVSVVGPFATAADALAWVPAPQPTQPAQPTPTPTDPTQPTELWVPTDLDGVTISTLSGDRPAPVRQTYFDTIATETADPDNHPHFPTYTHVATKNGLWTDPTLWSTGTVPGEGAVVNISTFDVTYNVPRTASPVKLWGVHSSGAGVLRWSKATETLMWVYTLFMHGKLYMGDSDSPIPDSARPGGAFAEIVWWFPEGPGTTVKGGLMTMDAVSIYGTPKADMLEAVSTLGTGATGIQFDPAKLAAANWKVGDELVVQATSNGGRTVVDPTYKGPTSIWTTWEGGYQQRNNSTSGDTYGVWGFRQSRDECRTISAINTTTGMVTLSTPLTYAHTPKTGSLPDGTPVNLMPRVSNRTRSILFRSADANDTAIWAGADLGDLQKRGHCMFMHSDEVWVGWARHKNGGRTDTDPTLTVVAGFPVYLSNGGANAANPLNVRARYPFHHHQRFGDTLGLKQSVFVGLVVDGQDGPSMSAIPVPGWGITHHGGRLAVHNCLTYNVRGAGIVSEFGTEIGQWINNNTLWCRGDGYPMSFGTRAEDTQNHNGHAGVGYENQSRQVLMHGNHFTSCTIGYSYFQQFVNTANSVSRSPDHLALRYVDPLTWGSGNINGQNTNVYGPEQPQIPPDFADNTGIGCRYAFWVMHRQFTERADTSPAIFRRCHWFDFDATGFENKNYTFNYSFYDCLWRGQGTGSGMSLGVVGWAFNVVNCRIQDTTYGIRDNGNRMNYNGHFIAQGGAAGMFVNVGTPIDQGPTTITTTNAPSAHPSFDLMDRWVVTQGSGSYSVKVRNWIVEEPSAFPMAPSQNYPKTARRATEPLPGTPKPYFWEDTTIAPDKAITPTDGSITFRGLIVDNLGMRRLGDWYSAESFNASTAPQADPRRSETHASGTLLVERNGCFLDGSTWKMPMWFNEHDRLTGNLFSFRVDVTLSGFDPAFLAAHTVNPAATKPQLPLMREAVPAVPPVLV